jgi:hypothetical protein
VQRRERGAVVAAFDARTDRGSTARTSSHAIIDEFDDRTDGRRVPRERRVDSLPETRETADHPPIQRGRLERRSASDGFQPKFAYCAKMPLYTF